MKHWNWETEQKKISGFLSTLTFTDQSGKLVNADDAFTMWRDVTLKVRASHRVCFLVGNGASASMASHMSADLAKNAHVHTQVFTDLSLLTAISNDFGYEHVYSEPLKRRGKKGDMLVTISSSGNSENVLEATKIAHQLDMYTVTLSAMKENNPLRQTGDLNGYVPADTYGHAETSHSAILHYWMDLVSNQPTTAHDNTKIRVISSIDIYDEQE